MSDPVDLAPTGLAPVPPSLAVVGAAIEARVRRLLDAEIARWDLVDEGLHVPLTQLRTLVLAGGKRLRPAFFHWAFVGAGGDPDDPRAVDLGAALEMLHTFALVHDDVMDNADTRRGGPAVHAEAIAEHHAAGWRGEARRFGEGVAILVGDFAFVYADMLADGLDTPARRIYDELRVELCVGQYLDLAATASGVRDPGVARRIEWYKSGKYTVERPLHLGAALAGRADDLRGPLSAFGLPLGEAFQMRDDLLSVFGDPELTGKPVGGDLREGKLTPLVAATAARADADGRALLDRIGAPDITPAEITALQQLMVDCGAVREVETAIEALVAESLTALTDAPITEDARAALAELGNFVAWRDPVTAVEISGLEKRYGDRVALAGIDLSIAEGEIFGLLGPNGAGKTTTVEILEGYRRADGGSVRVLGADPQADAARLRTQVGVMLQEGGLYPGLRPLELLRLYAAFYDDADDPERLLDVVGLRDAAGTTIRRLSGGQAQRLSLAAAIIGRPRLVFLDEPTAGMDPRARADTWGLVRDLRAGGTTVVLTTHYMDEAEQLCDRLAILDHGRIVAGGSPAEVTADAIEPCTRFSTGVAIDAAGLAVRLGRPVTPDGARTGEYSVGGTPSPELVADLTAWLRDAGVQVLELRTGSASLEEVFLRLTEEPELPAWPKRRAREREG